MAVPFYTRICQNKLDHNNIQTLYRMKVEKNAFCTVFIFEHWNVVVSPY